MNYMLRFAKQIGLKNLLFVLAFLSAFLLTNSCDNPSEPNDPPPGRRDYVWTVDTINPGYDYASLGRIWGSSAADVWAVGDGDALFRMWHYDGYKWTNYYKEATNSLEVITPTSIWGTANYNVWMGSANSTMWRYNGTQWSLYGEYKVVGYDRVIINNFDGISSNDIYGVGATDVYNSNTYKAVVMHYDGARWSFINVPDTKVSLGTVAVESKSGVLVTSGTVYDPSGFVAKVYSWDGKELKELLSGSGWSFVTKLNNEIFATLGRKIYKYSNKQLTLWKDNTGTGINGNIVCGRSRNDFFIGGYGGMLHYNGTDFSTIYPTNLTIQRGITFEKDVFFIGKDYSNMKNYIIHGQLK